MMSMSAICQTIPVVIDLIDLIGLFSPKIFSPLPPTLISTPKISAEKDPINSIKSIIVRHVSDRWLTVFRVSTGVIDLIG